MAAIKGELYVDYNGSMTRTHLATEAELVEGLDDAVQNVFSAHVVQKTSTELIEDNSVYDAGTIVIETNTKFFKVADGTTPYNDLEYLNGRNGALNGLLVEVKDEDTGVYDEQGIDDVILEYLS